MQITLIGLGVQEGDLSIKAKKALDSASKILVRTKLTASYESLKDYEVESLDYLFESSRSFDTLNRNLAKVILKEAKVQPVVYCVDGAISEDIACGIICKKAKDVILCEGVSKVNHCKAFAGLQHTQVSGVSAYDIQNLKSCPAAVVYDIDSDYMAFIVKEHLSNLFGEESECTFVRGGSAKKIKVYELDRQKQYDYSCSVAVEEGEFLQKNRYDYADLEQLIRLLRAPEGCPWDRVQTTESIKNNMIEEAYELVDAINKQDDDMILEETGDVLLQAAFHAVLKEEEGVFNGMDAISGVVKKLIFRHSHIFGNDKATDETSALSVWEKNKLTEKHQTTFGETLLAVPNNFPACMRAQKVQKRAGKSGMDFANSKQAGERLMSEVEELQQALQSGGKEKILEEAGDLLFSAVNTCRLAGVDCEQALSEATEKFTKRFIKTEELVLAEGKQMQQLSEQQLEEKWQQAKDAVTKY